jgi:carbamoyltransferase
MTNRPVYVLGINAYDHDVSACLLRDGVIRYAITKERLTREKHDTGFHQEVVDYCLAAEGISLSQVDLVVRNCYVLPVEDLEERLLYEDVPEFLGTEERWNTENNPLFLPDEPTKYITVSHHVAHAYSAFAACPFEEGAVMIVDGVGNYCSDVKEPDQLTEGTNPLARESESYYTFSGSDLTAVKKVWLEPTRGFLSDEFMFMPGLGALYSRVSCYIFGDWNKCGEVMGLAPYGRPNRMAPLLSIGSDGELHVPQWTRAFDRPWLADFDGDWEQSPKVPHWQDLAWQVQDDAERVLVHRAKWLREKTGAKNLCIAGGVGLNCVANGRISREAGFENIWVQPAAGDDGIAIGCAYYGYLHVLKKPRNFVMEHAYLGKPYTDEQVTKAAAAGLARFEIIKSKSDNICREAAELLRDGHVLGWFQGRSEFGPRALGNRSIISDPRTSEMKDKLNKRVKHRQAFRPFAPIVIYERAKEIFEGEHDSPFMLMAQKVRPEWRDRLEAITHVDGTARIQTVRADINPRLYKLLEEFDALTGVPVLLNTSFNVKGEPIVETPRDAVNCFLSTGIDYLAMHDLLLRKSQFNRIAAPARRLYGDMTTMVRTGVDDMR